MTKGRHVRGPCQVETPIPSPRISHELTGGASLSGTGLQVLLEARGSRDGLAGILVVEGLGVTGISLEHVGVLVPFMPSLTQ